VGALRGLLGAVNGKEHWDFYAKDKKNITKIIVQISREFIAFIIHIFVDPQLRE
jgi:hypothetical protein